MAIPGQVGRPSGRQDRRCCWRSGRESRPDRQQRPGGQPGGRPRAV